MKIWSASNVKVYGGSDNENDYLAGLERIIGAYWQHSRQTTYSAGQGTSTTTGMDAQQRQIATVADPVLEAEAAQRPDQLGQEAAPAQEQHRRAARGRRQRPDGHRGRPDAPAAAGRGAFRS